MPVVEFRLTNETLKAVAFYLEPWGGKYKIPAQGGLLVVIEAPSDPVLEWRLTDEFYELVVHDPAGTSAAVYDGDVEAAAV